jgi:hypothetical protein
MVQFPAFCPTCGLIFRSNVIDITGSTGIEMSGNREQCRRCGSMAELPDGTFSVADDTIEVLAATGLTRERLFRLQAVLDQVRTGDLPPADATEAIADEAPSLRPLLERFGPAMQRALIVFLLAVIQILAAQELAELRDDSATKQDVARAVEQAINYCQQQQP